MDTQLLLYIGLAAIVGAIGLFAFFFSSKKPVEEASANEPSKPAKQKEGKTKAKAPSIPNHPLTLAVMKTVYSDQVTSICFSPNNKYLLSTSGPSDRLAKLHELASIAEKVPKIYQVKLPFDYATSSAFSADGTHFIVFLGDSGDIVAYKILSKKNEEGKLYKEVARFKIKHSAINSLHMSSNNKFIFCCTDDSIVSLWSLKGVNLLTLNTNSVKINMGTVSPDSNFFAVASWTGEVKLWEVVSQKESGEFEKVQRGMELQGHKNNVFCVCFSADSKRVASTSKDGTFKLWKIDVRYKMGEDPTCILTVPAPAPDCLFDLISISPDQKLIAVTDAKINLHFYTIDGKLLETIPKPHDRRVLGIYWSPDSKFLASYAGNLIHLWKRPDKKQ